MTQRLEEFIAKLRTLPDEQQDAIAELIADDLADLRLLEARQEERKQTVRE